jgi:hypothetical protein
MPQGQPAFRVARRARMGFNRARAIARRVFAGLHG